MCSCFHGIYLDQTHRLDNRAFRRTCFSAAEKSMATDGKIGPVFHVATEIEPVGEPMPLPPDEAGSGNRAKCIRSIEGLTPYLTPPRELNNFPPEKGPFVKIAAKTVD